MKGLDLGHEPFENDYRKKKCSLDVQIPHLSTQVSLLKNHLHTPLINYRIGHILYHATSHLNFHLMHLQMTPLMHYITPTGTSACLPSTSSTISPSIQLTDTPSGTSTSSSISRAALAHAILPTSSPTSDPIELPVISPTASLTK